MPISAEPAVVVLTGNGSANTMALPWIYHDATYVKAKWRDADDVYTTLVYGVDFNLTATGSESGGTLTLTDTPAVGEFVYAYLDIPNTQPTRYKTSGAQHIENLNKDFDRLVERVAFLEEQVKRSFKLPLGDTTSDMEGTVHKSDLLGKLFKFNATTGKPEGVDPDEVMPGETTLPLSVANGGTGSASASAARAALAAAGTGAANTFTADQTIESTDAGASAGPSLKLFRNSASPANSDALGALNYTGKDDGANTVQWAKHFAEIVNVSAAAKSARITWQTYYANALASRFHMGGGFFATGLTDPGPGAGDFVGLYMNGVRAGFTRAAAVALSGGAGTTFSSLPSGLNWIDIILQGVSLDDTDDVLLRIGDATGMFTTGYFSSGVLHAAAGNTVVTSTAGFILPVSNAAETLNGIVSLRRLGTGHTWIASGAVDDGTQTKTVGGAIVLTADPDRIGILDTGGDNFDAGSIALQYG